MRNKANCPGRQTARVMRNKANFETGGAAGLRGYCTAVARWGRRAGWFETRAIFARYLR
jgi:hypothetical protein